ncbi:hypothetical protein [Actinacidiphila acididurans]|uniref:Uncharacterized protein n=1 Tax=Actinacidiphila acididurans TaxID=2784346 RepID=A0ABS2U4F1_9ACTN|nr:hypothetical protein [Actinacidiphila acididurans]MBM9510031.1 hypothetical protein [Actinacidiphila acididurans]
MAQPGAALPDPALVTLALRIQGMFINRGLSLADPETAEAYVTSVDALRLILDGARATGLLGDEQHATLTGMFDAAGTVPGVL